MSGTQAPAQAQAQTETVDQALNRALKAAQMRRIHEAIGICKDVLAAAPDNPGALGLMGGIYGQEGQTDLAIDHLERAIARQPNVSNWHLNLGALYRARGRFEEALRHGLDAVRLSPDTCIQRVELALTHLSMGDREACARAFREAMAREPENAAPHMGLGELLLSQGDYNSGWLEYAWRNKLEQAKGTLPKMIAAPWNGMKIPDGTLLIVCDQGFGDMIQFARYIPMVTERVPNLIIGWGPEVTALLGDHPSIKACIPAWANVPPHDAYVLLSSLPQIFGTTLDNIPMPIPYLHMKPEQIARWGARLDELLPQRRMRVGLAWSGRPTHPNNARRSLRLAELAPILNVPGVDFVSVQKPMPAEDRAVAEGMSNFIDLADELESFADTGAVLCNLDLLISVDTAVVHLAGAMARDAWVMLPEPADWRWLLDREDTVWYQTLRLFRQKTVGDWGPVFARVAEALRGRVAAD